MPLCRDCNKMFRRTKRGSLETLCISCWFKSHKKRSKRIKENAKRQKRK